MMMMMMMILKIPTSVFFGLEQDFFFLIYVVYRD